MNVFWTDNAKTHLRDIYNYISLHSEQYAKRTVDRITKTSGQIAAFPLSGRKVSKYNLEQIREVIEKPYRIIYYIKQDQIDILAVVHCSMNIIPPQEY